MLGRCRRTHCADVFRVPAVVLWLASVIGNEKYGSIRRESCYGRSGVSECGINCILANKYSHSVQFVYS
jgi:hypothetical protein